MSKERNWLDVTEYVSVAASGVGTVAALVSGQAAVAAFPLTIALSLNLLNRRRLQAQVQRGNSNAIAQFHKLEGEISSLGGQLSSLDEQFSTRPEIKALPQLREETNSAIALLQNKVTGEFIDLGDRLFSLTQQFNTRPEIESIPQLQNKLTGELTHIRGQLTNLVQEFNTRPEIESIPKLQTQIETTIINLGDQIISLNQQFNSRPEIELIPQLQNKLTGELTHLRGQLTNLVQEFNHRPEIESIPKLQTQLETKIINLGDQLFGLNQLFNSRPEIESIPKLQTQLETKIINLGDQLFSLNQLFNSRPEIESIPKLQNQVTGEFTNLWKQIFGLKEDFNLRPEIETIPQLQKQVEGEFTKLWGEVSGLTKQFNYRPEIETIPQLQNQINGAFTNLWEQISGLKEEFNSRPEIEIITQLENQITDKITNLWGEFSSLTQQFNSRPEVNAIANLEAQVIALAEPPKLENWPGIKIKVIGIGKSADKAINKMVASRVPGVEFLSINTDARALELSIAHNNLQIGKDFTQGLSSGGDASLGEKAAEESRSEIAATIQNCDLAFIVAGMGGGTGTGAAPIVAEIAKENGALTIGVVTTPFIHEGRKRHQLAEEGIANLRNKVDMLVVIPIDKVMGMISEWTPIQQGFQLVNELVRQTIESIADIINRPGLVNIDFADLKKALTSSGCGVIGVGMGNGKLRAKSAAMAAISSPLIQVGNSPAKNVIFYMTGSKDLSIQEVNAAAEIISEFTGKNTNVIFGAGIDERLEDEVRITLIANGLNIK